tara:strand:- start:663 stop:836 length:174 start_codon:yes stop_codon:yes gene_type:complete
MENNKQNRLKLARLLIENLTNEQIKNMLTQTLAQDLTNNILFEETIMKIRKLYGEIK